MHPDDLQVTTDGDDAAAPVAAIVAASPAALVAAQANPIRLAIAQRYPLATMTDNEFAQLMSARRTHEERMRSVQRDGMVYGVHFSVPGMTEEEWLDASKKDKSKVRSPGILKPGVEFLCKLHDYKLTSEYRAEYGDATNETSPAITIYATSRVHVGSIEGPVVAMASAACNSWETKYRWREGRKRCPECERAGLILQRAAKGGAFKGQATAWCSLRDGGCGAEFLQSDERIANQQVGRVTNTDAFDMLNTYIKIAVKRATSSAVVEASGTSGLFVVDLDDLPQTVIEEIERESRETLAKMYGDANPKGNGGGAPKAAPEHITEGQTRAIRSLLAMKLGLADQDAVDREIATRCGAGGLKDLTFREAASLIESLNDLPNQPTSGPLRKEIAGSHSAAAGRAPRAVAHPPANKDVEAEESAMVDSVENRDHLRSTIRRLDGVLKASGQSPMFGVDDIGDFELLVNEAALEAIGYGKPSQTEFLSVTELLRVLKMARAMTAPRTTEGVR